MTTVQEWWWQLVNGLWEVEYVDKPNSEVVTTYDPKFFEWGRGERHARSKPRLAVKISPTGTIYLSKDATQKIIEQIEPTDGRYYYFEIGIAKKAIAFRPLPPGEQGYRFRHYKSGLIAHSAYLVSRLPFELPLKAELFWDDRHKMLVAKVE